MNHKLSNYIIAQIFENLKQSINLTCLFKLIVS